MEDPTREKVAILGGGVAGLAAAWRLSEPGWQDRFRVDHRLRAELASRWQGGQQPRTQRPDRGTRASCLARLLRERLPAGARGLRRTGPGEPPTTGTVQSLDRCLQTRQPDRARGFSRRCLGPLGGDLLTQRRIAGRARCQIGTDGGRGVLSAVVAASRRLLRLARNPIVTAGTSHHQRQSYSSKQHGRFRMGRRQEGRGFGAGGGLANRQRHQFGRTAPRQPGHPQPQAIERGPQPTPREAATPGVEG